MIKRIYTWGKRYADKGFKPPDVKTFSALDLYNPWHASKDGRDPEVSGQVMNDPKAERLIGQIIDCGEEEVGVYCYGGRHRSVAIAEEVAKRTGAEVVHLSEGDWKSRQSVIRWLG
jgi:RNase adaptor protein for sRNA GlmZ degradation